ncbi:schwannomin interacting protein, putative [Ixodes scapularis]|uniref:Schwannomin interacting protein, putative n=1 Tax=Ixodes scapularis TaxID=6945 RepID=B7QBL7_IXOSC|nr:schwannomin interacting protein, putative [Ixodes scapularis]|eukprot:XP_002412943.1 schwannomin interacting protein, putative [Ixodes scapularis]
MKGVLGWIERPSVSARYDLLCQQDFGYPDVVLGSAPSLGSELDFCTDTGDAPEEEIRRKLAMDTDVEEVERRKPSLTSRLQGSKSLQVVEASAPGPARRPSLLFGRRRVCRQPPEGEEAFSVRQARLQAEARMALAQAKEMARMQMEVERQQRKKSPIAEIVGIAFPDGRHRLSRQMLTDMNVAQLQVIVNDLHSQIESHNEDLVRFLLERDDLHMEQDSMLVDIEDMTRYLGAKNSQENTGVSSIQPEAK